MTSGSISPNNPSFSFLFSFRTPSSSLMHQRLELNPWNKILMSPGRHFLIPSLAFCMEKRWLLQGSSIQHQRNIELSPFLYVVNNRFLVII